MTQVVIIDNYDSFTYNLEQAVGTLLGEGKVLVRRNDAITAASLADLQPTHLIISPGPGRPRDAGNSNSIISHWAGKTPILGVCLGHQCIAEVFGGKIVPARRCMHGKTSMIRHDGKGIFRGLPNPFRAMRYHSLTVEPAGLRGDFVISAYTPEGEIMALRSEKLAVEGVQFHPESFATEVGMTILQNFLSADSATFAASRSQPLRLPGRY